VQIAPDDDLVAGSQRGQQEGVVAAGGSVGQEEGPVGAPGCRGRILRGGKRRAVIGGVEPDVGGAQVGAEQSVQFRIEPRAVLVSRRGEGNGAGALVRAQRLDDRGSTMIVRRNRRCRARGYSLVNQSGNQLGILSGVRGVSRDGERVP
jgi:hypothetical protein